MTRYYGNTGRREHFPEPEPELQSALAQPREKPPRHNSGRGGSQSFDFSKLLSRFSLSNLEQEDLLLMLVVYLLYRESGDTELLITLGALLFL